MVSWLEAPYYLLYEGSLSWNSVQLGDVQAKTQKKEDNVVSGQILVAGVWTMWK